MNLKKESSIFLYFDLILDDIRFKRESVFLSELIYAQQEIIRKTKQEPTRSMGTDNDFLDSSGTDNAFAGAGPLTIIGLIIRMGHLFYYVYIDIKLYDVCVHLFE